MEEEEIDEVLAILDGEKTAENRGAERKNTDIPIQFMHKNLEGELIPDIKRVNQATVIDISSTGIGLVTKETLYPKEQYFIQANLGKVMLKAEILVVYFRKKDDSFHYGCRFVQVFK